MRAAGMRRLLAAACVFIISAVHTWHTCASHRWWLVLPVQPSVPFYNKNYSFAGAPSTPAIPRPAESVAGTGGPPRWSFSRVPEAAAVAVCCSCGTSSSFVRAPRAVNPSRRSPFTVISPKPFKKSPRKYMRLYIYIYRYSYTICKRAGRL